MSRAEFEGTRPRQSVATTDPSVPRDRSRKANRWHNGSQDRKGSRNHDASGFERAGVDLEAAARHLRFLDRHEPRHTFQVAPDLDGAPRRIYHGPLAAVAGHLIRANEAGAGVFVMVNAGDLRGRKRENVRHIRFVFVDLDGAPLPDDVDVHGVIRSSPGKAHVYWRVNGIPVELFRPIQLGLARTFGGDESVTDPPRVLRLAGFLHRKGRPFRVRSAWLDHGARPLSLAELRSRFPLVDTELTIAKEAARHRALGTPGRAPVATVGVAGAFAGRLLDVVTRKAACIASTGRHSLLVWAARTCLDNDLSEADAVELMLRARDLLPARNGGPVPDAEVIGVVNWAYANLRPGTPWSGPMTPNGSAGARVPPRLAGQRARRTSS